jgi:hypothetical protein
MTDPENEQAQDAKEVQVVDELLFVAEKIDAFFKERGIEDLSATQLFTSDPGETGGISEYPRLRVDNHLVNINDCYSSIKNLDKNKYFVTLSIYILKLILWLFIGFDDIDTFSNNPKATSSWTEGYGHTTSSEERATHIQTEGKKWINEELKKFAEFRKNHSELAKNDVFTKYNLEDLLEKYAD